MQFYIRCTRVKDKPDVHHMASYNPQIEQCEQCKEDIWVTAPSRVARKFQGEGNSITLCRVCADAIAVTHFKTEKDASMMYINGYNLQVTEIKVK